VGERPLARLQGREPLRVPEPSRPVGGNAASSVQKLVGARTERLLKKGRSRSREASGSRSCPGEGPGCASGSEGRLTRPWPCSAFCHAGWAPEAETLTGGRHRSGGRRGPSGRSCGNTRITEARSGPSDNAGQQDLFSVVSGECQFFGRRLVSEPHLPSVRRGRAGRFFPGEGRLRRGRPSTPLQQPDGIGMERCCGRDAEAQGTAGRTNSVDSAYSVPSTCHRTRRRHNPGAKDCSGTVWLPEESQLRGRCMSCAAAEGR